ncbi:MAG: UvrD-helicase domain-containing protein [Pirellulaceae bacterium]|nr:UvrD-helicase domain-containing protein [Pirellulaceae bacterium]
MSSTNLLAGLNSSQRTAVTHLDGPLLILAGPGSGKTRVITQRVAYMIDQGIAPQHILGLTFTNKAASEMRQRVQRLVGRDDVWLGTFHGFCVRLLRRYARLVGLPENFSIYDTDDSHACLKQALAEAKFELTHTSLGALAQRISYFKNRLVTPEVLESEALSSSEYQVAQVYPFYQRALLRCGAADFDDLLLHTALLLRQHASVREQLDRQFQYVMVDEYQDTNLAQYVILRHLCVDNRNLAATGDPDQSIYGWRGANLKNVTHLERDYHDLKIVRLEDNYRSTPEILSAADCLIQNNQYRKHKQLVPSRAGGHKVRLAIYPNARAEAEDIGQQIATLVSQGENRLSDFGILYRTNAQSRLIEQAMLRRQLPYQLVGGFRFYLRKEIKDLIAYLLLLYNSDDDIALQRIINVPPRGIGKQTLQRIGQLASSQDCGLLQACRNAVQQNHFPKKTTAALRGFLELYDQLSRKTCDSLTALLQSVLEETDYRGYLAKQRLEDSDRHELLQNIDELLAEAYDLDAVQHEDRPALERFLEVVALQSDTDRLATGSDMVTLMTLHAAKGLEFRNLYIVAVEENILPHARSRDDAGQLEEERRLLFVGITRAQDRLQLSYALNRGFAGSGGSGIPSSFLMELPRHEMVIVDHCDRSSSMAQWDGSDTDDWARQDGPDYDEACQLPHEVDAAVQYDDDCQLPEEELRQRIGRRRTASSSGRLMVASQLATSGTNWSAFQPGCKVSHPQWGTGQIISTTGHGPKRSVTVRFSDDQQARTFRLSHAQLQLEE